jgi:hypothetical protein
METETSVSRRRPRIWLIGILGLVVVGFVARQMWPSQSPASPAPAATPTRAASSEANGKIRPGELKVQLEALETARPDPGEAARNPFRFRPPPAPPPPKPGSMLPPVAPPPGPPPPPPIPPIPLKFMGTVEGPGVKLAALTDCKGFTYSGREGETIDGRYKLVRIQTESIIMEYPNGTGRITIRKTGECGGVVR